MTPKIILKIIPKSWSKIDVINGSKIIDKMVLKNDAKMSFINVKMEGVKNY
jgi:hypothetical protein